jgi:hypothetical protein
MGIQRGDQAGQSTSSTATDSLIEKFGQLNVLDDLIRLRAADHVQHPILAYPSSEKDAASYIYYTGRDLDGMIDDVVAVLVESGFPPVRHRLNSKSTVVGQILTPYSPKRMAPLWLSSPCPMSTW